MFQDLKHILLLTTDYTGANKAQKVHCSRHQCCKGYYYWYLLYAWYESTCKPPYRSNIRNSENTIRCPNAMLIYCWADIVEVDATFLGWRVGVHTCTDDALLCKWLATSGHVMREQRDTEVRGTTMAAIDCLSRCRHGNPYWPELRLSLAVYLEFVLIRWACMMSQIQINFTTLFIVLFNKKMILKWKWLILPIY